MSASIETSDFKVSPWLLPVKYIACPIMPTPFSSRFALSFSAFVISGKASICSLSSSVVLLKSSPRTSFVLEIVSVEVCVNISAKSYNDAYWFIIN